MNWNCYICGDDYGKNLVEEGVKDGPMNVCIDGDMRFICPRDAKKIRAQIRALRKQHDEAVSTVIGTL